MTGGEWWWLAARTRKRMGAAPWLFLALGLCALLTGLSLRATIRREQNAPCSLTVQGAQVTAQDLAAISGLEGVTGAYPVLEVPATVQGGGMSLNLTIWGENSGLLDGKITGTVYPENSAMVYLVLNRAAAKALGESVSAGMTLEIAPGIPALLCGILEDDQEIPMGFVSESSARALLGPGSACQRMELLLERRRDLPRILPQLRQMGYSAETADPSALWAVPETKARGQLALGAISLLASAMFLYREMAHDMARHREEYVHLAVIMETEKPARAIHARWLAMTVLQGGSLGVLLWLLLRMGVL